MGRIEYTINPKLDINGNKVYYYRFLDNNGVDYTDYFGFIGRKTSWKKVRVIRSQTSPAELYNMFHTDLNFRFYRLPELAQAQKEIDKCNNHNGCDTYCGNPRIEKCTKILTHTKYMRIARQVKDIIDSPESSYIEVRK